MSNNATHHKLHMVKIKGKWFQCCEWIEGNWFSRYRAKRQARGLSLPKRNGRVNHSVEDT